MLSRRELDELTESVKSRHAMGLAWIKVGEGGWQGPIAKYFERRRESRARRSCRRLEDRRHAADGRGTARQGASGSRRHPLAARPRNSASTNPTSSNFCGSSIFRCSSYSAEDKRLVSVNHPFTAPHPDDLAMLESAPLKARALAYDMVLNGQELGGGSIRIHSRELQLKVFELLGFTREEAMDRFGFLLDALNYGAPPHGGIAFGVDRICMMLCGTDSLRDVIAFPKTQKAVDPMSGAPSEVDAAPAQGTVDQGDVMKAGWLTIAGAAGAGRSRRCRWRRDAPRWRRTRSTPPPSSISDAINQRDVKAHAVRSIKTITISRIAVMPVVEDAGRWRAAGSRSGAEAITAELYSRSRWPADGSPIPESDVMDAMQKMPPTTLDNLDENALKLGHDVSADGVLYGTVERYKERVGMDYAASSPAVSGVLAEVRRYEEQANRVDGEVRQVAGGAQRRIFSTSPTSCSVPDAGCARTKSRRRASRKRSPIFTAISTCRKNVKRFETGSYGELKSGQQRYSTGPQGIY